MAAPTGGKDEAADSAASQAQPSLGVHEGVRCDRSGMDPIVGIRYHLRGENYDLCQAEYDKLPKLSKALYDAIEPPSFSPDSTEALVSEARLHSRGRKELLSRPAEEVVRETMMKLDEDEKRKVLLTRGLSHSRNARRPRGHSQH